MALLLNGMLIVAMGGVLVSLLTGLFSFVRGPATHDRYGNKMMRWRVGLQLAAVLLALGAILLSR